MNRSFLVLAAVALLSMLAGVLLFEYLKPEQAAISPAGSVAPVELHSIPLTDLEQQPSVVDDWRGNVLIVNFWATWCAPCRREIPALVEVQREYADQGLRILGIAFDNAEQVTRFAADYQINYPLFLSGNRSAMYNAAFGNPSGSLPFTAMLDRDLRIIFRHNGELSPRQLREQLEISLNP